MLAPPRMRLLLLAIYTAHINMAIHDPEATILSYISEFLNPEECHELYLQLAILPKDAEQPSAEKDLFPTNQWQDISNVEQCKESLHQWLKMQRDAMDWDRLAQILQQIGRPDISQELKKRLNKNRSLEPKWSPEENQTREGPKSALIIEQKAPFRRTRHRHIQKHQKTFLKEEGCGPIASFLKWLSFSFHNLPEYIGPAIRLLIASFLTGLSLWIISFCYIMSWNLRQCFLANRGYNNGTVPWNRLSLTVTWNQTNDEYDTEDPDTSEEDEREDTEEER